MTLAARAGIGETGSPWQTGAGRGDEANSRRRLVVIGVIVMALFGGLLTRLWFLQVAGEKLAVAAQAEPRPVREGPRGPRHDLRRQGQRAGPDHPRHHAHREPPAAVDTERATLRQNLGSLLGIDAATVDQRIDNEQYASYLPVPVAENIDLPTAVYVIEHRDLFPEVAVTRTAERSYPNNFQAADMLGYVGQINGKELAAHKGDGYQASDIVGKYGLEQMFESELRGTPGLDKVEVDNQGRAVNVVEVKKPVAGHDVRLTVDLGVQQVARDLPGAGHGGCPVAGRPRQRLPLRGERRRGRRAERAGWLGGGAGLEPELRPQRLREGRRRQVLQRPEPPTDQPGAERVRAGVDVQDVHGAGHAAERPLPRGRRPCERRGPARVLHVRQRRAALQRGAERARLPVACAPRSRCRATCTSTRWATSSGTATATRARKVGPGDDLAGDKLPDAEHPVGNAIQHTAATYGFGESTGVGLDDQAGIIPNHEYRVKLNPTTRSTSSGAAATAPASRSARATCW